MTKMNFALVGILLFVSACASSGKKFGRLYPGMKKDQVIEVMGKGPTKVDQFPEAYTAWYYGNDRCLLLKEDEIVSKSQTEKKGGIEVFGVGGASERQPAECVPLGQAKRKKTVKSLETPWGTVER